MVLDGVVSGTKSFGLLGTHHSIFIQTFNYATAATAHHKHTTIHTMQAYTNMYVGKHRKNLIGKRHYTLHKRCLKETRCGVIYELAEHTCKTPICHNWFITNTQPYVEDTMCVCRHAPIHNLVISIK